MENEELVLPIDEQDMQAITGLPDPDLLQYYNDSSNRCYWLDEDISADCLWLVKAILSINREDAGKPSEERQPIKIFIDSSGGDVDAMRSIIDAIELSKTPVTTINMCKAYSAAFEIFLSGHRRMCMPRARFMIHDGSVSLPMASYAEHLVISEQLQRIIAESRQYIIDHTDITEDMLNEHIGELDHLVGRDWFFGAKEAYDLWVVDEIISDIEELT